MSECVKPEQLIFTNCAGIEDVGDGEEPLKDLIRKDGFKLGQINPVVRAADVKSDVEKSILDESLASKKPLLLGPKLEHFLGKQMVDWSRVCLLDMQASEELCPEDAEKFDIVVFGGILGNITQEEDDDGTVKYGSDDRTSELRQIGFAHRRHLGFLQMTTDSALLTTKLVLEDKKTLSELPYIDEPDVEMGANESTQMEGFRYISSDILKEVPIGIRTAELPEKIKKKGQAHPILPRGMLPHWIESADDPLLDEF